MEPPPAKKNKLEDTAESVQAETRSVVETSPRDVLPGDVPSQSPPISVRQQLCDLLSEASAKSCGTSLPMEMLDKIIDYCLCNDFSQLPAEVFSYGHYEVLGVLQDDASQEMFADPLRQEQLKAIKNLPGEPLDAWGPVPEENGDLSIWWTHVFPVGWKGSGELLEFDLWMCCEAHHWHGVFVFEKGSTEVLLRYEPVEF